MIEYVIGAVIGALVGAVPSGYFAYKYGQGVERRARAVIAKIEAARAAVVK